jgi:hypothetical protein
MQVMAKAGRRDELVEHVGSAHNDADLGVLLGRPRGAPRSAVNDIKLRANRYGTRPPRSGRKPGGRCGSTRANVPAATPSR